MLLLLTSLPLVYTSTTLLILYTLPEVVKIYLETVRETIRVLREIREELRKGGT